MTKIQLNHLSFNYNDKTPVFDNHQLLLEIPETQTHKLYGIIGPSGTGKTTLVSILGGQLNPSGEVLVNDTNIYQVNDLVRRDLLAFQMQTATSLRGELKYNLLFGLPISNDTNDENETNENQIYSDSELIEVLEEVGLWNLFSDKDGLKTLIGEGGLNLSGGQRQRLNFASLYLRAKFFHPKLILIDEPTSSLDEISERAITNMIDELSELAVTFVVAHRLKTLDSAQGILDISLAKQDKNLQFMNQVDLLEKSSYYRDLRAGKAILEE